MIYFVQSEIGGPIKIGYTSRLRARMSAMQTDCPFGLVVLATMPGDRSHESGLHVQFYEWRVGGEWYDPACQDLVRLVEGLGGAPITSTSFTWTKRLERDKEPRVRAPSRERGRQKPRECLPSMASAAASAFGTLLVEHDISDPVAGSRLGVSYNSVFLWRHGKALPRTANRLAIQTFSTELGAPIAPAMWDEVA